MTRKEALKQLTADSAHDRLKAARFLIRNCMPEDASGLRRVLQHETVSYVRTSLKLALTRIENAGQDLTSCHIEENEDLPDPDLLVQIKNQITEQITGQILHEVASPVGLLAASATREIPNFNSSKTKVHIENLQRVLEAIEQLKVASATPKPREFDLSGLLLDIVTNTEGSQQVDVSLHGTKPFIITSDEALLSFALSNGIRNAIEAVMERTSDEPHPVIITWGETDIDYWVVVIDRGDGIDGPVESAFGIGKTTKHGHSGFGLTIAKKAIETLGGSCILQPAVGGGAHFEIRWES